MAKHCTAPITLRTRGGSGSTQSFPVESTNVIFNGSLVWTNNSTGRCTSIPEVVGSYLSTQSDTPIATDLGDKAHHFLGIAAPPTNSVTGNSGGTVLCPVNQGGITIEGVAVAGTTSASVNQAVYAVWNDVTNAIALKNTVGTDTTRRAIGYIVAWTSTSNADVKLFDSEISRSTLDPGGNIN